MRNGGVSRELFDKLFVVVIGSVLGVCAFGLNRLLSEIDKKYDGLETRIGALATRGDIQGERLIRVEESYKWISAELTKLGSDIGQVNNKLDQLIEKNR